MDKQKFVNNFQNKFCRLEKYSYLCVTKEENDSIICIIVSICGTIHFK